MLLRKKTKIGKLFYAQYDHLLIGQHAGYNIYEIGSGGINGCMTFQFGDYGFSV